MIHHLSTVEARDLKEGDEIVIVTLEDGTGVAETDSRLVFKPVAEIHTDHRSWRDGEHVAVWFTKQDGDWFATEPDVVFDPRSTVCVVRESL